MSINNEGSWSEYIARGDHKAREVEKKLDQLEETVSQQSRQLGVLKQQVKIAAIYYYSNTDVVQAVFEREHAENEKSPRRSGYKAVKQARYRTPYVPELEET